MSLTGIGALQGIQNQPTMSLWSLDVPLKIRIMLATYVNVRDRGEVSLKTFSRPFFQVNRG